MARKAKRVAVERGLYRAGEVWWACATPKGQRTARWLRLGDMGIQEARRRRDEFAYKLNARQSLSAHAALPCEGASRLVRSPRRARGGRELRPRTVASYKDGVRLHFTPTFGSRQLASVTPDDFVDWHEKQRVRRRGLVGSGTLDGDPRAVRIRRADGTNRDQPVRPARAARAPEAGESQAAVPNDGGDEDPVATRFGRRLDCRAAAAVLGLAGIRSTGPGLERDRLHGSGHPGSLPDESQGRTCTGQD